VNLRPLRPYLRLFREKLDPQTDAWMHRDLIDGYDAILLLPISKPGERKLGGRCPQRVAQVPETWGQMRKMTSMIG